MALYRHHHIDAGHVFVDSRKKLFSTAAGRVSIHAAPIFWQTPAPISAYSSVSTISTNGFVDAVAKAAVASRFNYRSNSAVKS